MRKVGRAQKKRKGEGVKERKRRKILIYRNTVSAEYVNKILNLGLLFWHRSVAVSLLTSALLFHCFYYFETS